MCLVVFHLFFFELTPFATTEIQFLSADLPYSLHSWTTLVQISLEDELKFYYLWDIILEYLQVLLVVFFSFHLHKNVAIRSTLLTRNLRLDGK